MEILQGAYPDEPQREHAIRWLGWIAYHLGTRRAFKRSDLSGWLPKGTLLSARALTFVLVMGAAYGIVFLVAPRWRAPVADAVSLIPIFSLVVLWRPWCSAMLAEIVLLLEWLEAPRFGRLLAIAEQRAIVARAGSGYEFADPGVPPYLADRYEAALVERAARQGERVARSAVLAVVAGADWQGSVLIRAGRWLPARVGSWLNRRGQGSGPFRSFLLVVANLYLALITLYGLAVSLLLLVVGALVRAVCWTLLNWASFPRKVRLGMAAGAAGAAAVVTAGAGTAAAAVVAYLLPAAFIAVLGLWACALVYRATRGKHGRGWQAARQVTLLVAESATITLLADRALLTTVPALGVLFPPAVWGAFRLWRTMSGSDRPAFLRAGADIALSLALGAELVLFLVWLANILGMPRSEMAFLRDQVLGRAGEVADLHWWIWALVWCLLAGASLAFALRPSRLAPVRRWFRRLGVLPAADVISRGLSGIHIGLLVVIFVAAAAPAGLAPTFQRQLKTAYLVALQRQFAAEGDRAAFEEILRYFSAAPRGTGPGDISAVPGPLLSLVEYIHDQSPPPPGDHNATAREADLARRIGILQAQTLDLPAETDQAVQAAEQARARDEGFDDQSPNAPELADHVEKVETTDDAADDAAERAKQVGETMVKVVTSLLSVLIPLHSDNELFQITEEYLSGLVEQSRLSEVFTAMAEKLPGARVPSAEAAVTPDPGGLERAAAADFSPELVADGDGAEVAAAKTRPPLAAAVALVDQELSAQASSSQCAGCQPGGSRSGQQDQGNQQDEEPGEEPGGEPGDFIDLGG